MGIAKIIHLSGVLVAVIAGLLGGFGYSGLLIAVLGLIGGWFIAKDERSRFLIAVVALIAVQGTLTVIPAIGHYLTGALAGLAALYSAAAVTVIVVATVDAVRP